jgi:peptidyl-prolyl cis-trans isomerase D
MLDFIRTHRRITMLALLFLIVPSFLAFGVADYFASRGNDAVVAKVGDTEITQVELDQAYRQQMDTLRRMYGDQFDQSQFDTPDVRRRILEDLIVQRAIAVEAARNNLTASDQALRNVILQQWQTPEGTFDKEAYQSFLALQGMNAEQFEARLRQNIALRQLTNAVEETAFAPRTLANRVADILAQERVVQSLAFPAQDFMSKVKVTEEMLKEYYEQHAGDFVIPEQVKAQYLVLDSDAVARQISVSDADIQQYYEQNKQRFADPEERRARHILINVPADASEADKGAAKEKAQKILEQVRSNPDNFPALAKEYSQDPGSAERGGDLGFFGRGDMVPPFEEAVFGLNQGQISDLVQTDFGFHIIQVTDVKKPDVPPLAQVRDKIEAEIRNQLATKRTSEMAETLTNIAYEQPGSLKPAAEKLNLEVKTAENLTRQPNPASPADAPYNQPKFLSALFSEDALKNKNNTEVIEVAPNTLIVGRVLEHQPATKRPFEQVKEAIRKEVVQQQAIELAQQAGEERLEALKSGAQPSGFGAAKTVSRNDLAGLPPQGFLAAMKADAQKLPTYVGVELPNGYHVYRINEVRVPENADPQRTEMLKQQVETLMGSQETVAYIEALKAKAETEILQNAPATSTAETAGVDSQ